MTKQAGQLIGKRLESLLRGAVRVTSNFTGSVQTAQSAEHDSLLKIDSYRDASFKELTADDINRGAKAWGCYYTLTEEGTRLRQQLLSGDATTVKDQRDPALVRLLEQCACLHYTKTPEPAKDYTWDSEPTHLINLGDHWTQHGLARLKAERMTRHTFYYEHDSQYDSEEFNTGLFAEASAAEHDCSFQLVIHLHETHNYVGNGPIQLGLELHAHSNSREYFRRILSDYPRVLSDILDYGGSLKFDCNVPLEHEPSTRAKAMEWLRAYFHPGETDDEEHFFLSTHFDLSSTQAHVRRNFLSALAIYDSACAADGWQKEPDRLLDYHRILCGSRRRV